MIDGNGDTGVVVLNGLTWIEDNDITGNVSRGVLLAFSAHLNTVVRNFMPFNTVSAVVDVGGGNHVGAITATASSSDVWSNIAY